MKSFPIFATSIFGRNILIECLVYKNEGASYDVNKETCNFIVTWFQQEDRYHNNLRNDNRVIRLMRQKVWYVRRKA